MEPVYTTILSAPHSALLECNSFLKQWHDMAYLSWKCR